jgi:hypothetical protein
MQLTKKQKIQNIIFRISVFSAFVASAAEFFMFVTLGAAGNNSGISYSSTLNIALDMCNVYFFLLAVGVIAVILSVVCCKISSVAAVVVRTIFLLIAAGANFVSISTYITIRDYARSYLAGEYLDMYSFYRYMSSDSFEKAVVAAILMVMLSSLIYFVLSITSIVSLAAKPKQPLNYNSGYYANNQWNNPNYANPQWSQGNTQWNNQDAATPYQKNAWNNGQSSGQDIQQNTVDLQSPSEEGTSQVYYDENGVKQLRNGRRVLKYDVMTGQPIYADEEQTDNESKNTDIL